MEKRLVLPDAVEAPVEDGQKVGTLEYWLGEARLGEIPILADGNVRKAGFLDCLKKMAAVFELTAGGNGR